jgi:hypothetical protein
VKTEVGTRLAKEPVNTSNKRPGGIMRRLTSLLALALLVAATGCKPEAEPVSAEPVSAAQAQPAGNALSSSTEDSASSYSEDGATSGFGTVTCTVTEDADGVDVDADNVPDNGASVTVANCQTDERNGIANASYSVTDDLVESSTAMFPFNFSIIGHWDVTAAGGVGPDAYNGRIDVDRTIVATSDANSIGGSDEGSVSAELEGPDASVTSVEAYAWDTGYTQTGDLFGDGLMSLSGEWNVEMTYKQGENEARVFANSAVMAVGTGLQLSSSCPTHVIGGTLAATYAAGDGENEFDATLNVTWNGCGSSTTTYVANPPQS